MRDSVLVLNAGSSRIKFALYPVQGSRLGKRTLGGHVANIGKSPRIQASRVSVWVVPTDEESHDQTCDAPACRVRAERCELSASGEVL